MTYRECLDDAIKMTWSDPDRIATVWEMMDGDYAWAYYYRPRGCIRKAAMVLRGRVIQEFPDTI